MKMFINPGHCPGVDPGAVNGKYNVKEAIISLNVGELTAKYLTAAGYEVKLLQSNNLAGETTGPNVCRTANQWAADLFISIHCNSHSNPQANGTECLVMNKWSRAAEVAECIQNRIVSSLGTTDRNVKENPYLSVLKNTVMPAVLVEMAFISNEEDVQLLMHKADDFARAIACGVTDYLQITAS